MSVANHAKFDQYASQYDEALLRGVRLSGEGKEYFAEKRVAWLKQSIPSLMPGLKVLDFGCGVGSSCSYLKEGLKASEVVGVDISIESITVARKRNSGKGIRFITISEMNPGERFDLVFCNGVFHHIPPPERAECIRFISSVLKPNGYFALWENNPWNPATHLVMSLIPFDRDAVKLFPHEALQLVRNGGMEVLSVTFMFLFPRFLSVLRKIEPLLSRFPLGAQYQVLAKKIE